MAHPPTLCQMNHLNDVATSEVRDLRQLVEVLKAQVADGHNRGAEAEEAQVDSMSRVSGLGSGSQVEGLKG